MSAPNKPWVAASSTMHLLYCNAGRNQPKYNAIVIVLPTPLSELYPRERQRKLKAANTMIFREVSNMREEYDFTNARRNPYMKKEKQQITINLDKEVDCTANKREL